VRLARRDVAVSRRRLHEQGNDQPLLYTGNAQHLYAALRQYVTDNHFMETLAFHSIPGGAIIKRFGYPACR
jgi:hypothetical protein